MSKARVSTASYRVDWIDGNKDFCFGFFSATKAWDCYIEGVKRAMDEVLIFDFTGGRRSAILLASHSFKQRTKLNVTEGKKEILTSRQAAQS